MVMEATRAGSMSWFILWSDDIIHGSIHSIFLDCW
jgi:hypothetical protein